MPGHVLLSEIHPRLAYFDPLVQAHEWFGLLDAGELASLRSDTRTGYLDAIILIHERCTERNLKLVIRDWTHIDFTPGAYPVHPALRLSQIDVLATHFDIRNIALTRNPVDSYLSLNRLSDYRGRLDVYTYLKGVRAYANCAAGTGFVRYEDLCRLPLACLEHICSRLDLHFDAGFTGKFAAYTTITGDNYTPRQQYSLTGERIADRTNAVIRPAVHRPEYAELASRLAGHPDYEFTLKTLGYDSTRDQPA